MILCPLPYNTLVQLKNTDKCHGASSVGTVARAELSVVGARHLQVESEDSRGSDFS